MTCRELSIRTSTYFVGTQFNSWQEMVDSLSIMMDSLIHTVLLVMLRGFVCPLILLFPRAPFVVFSSLLSSLHDVKREGLAGHICQESPQVLSGSSRLINCLCCLVDIDLGRPCILQKSLVQQLFPFLFLLHMKATVRLLCCGLLPDRPLPTLNARLELVI